ncbi:putative divalent cation/proton antiporter TMEM165 isoform X2 [Halichondria panicea]|uniref:putative divalent cation/proton antiporter TMEM165 isoform X2 n=1 Tax=Halichondria panicea TaxID=6063 RepID=UPI00312B6479
MPGQQFKLLICISIFWLFSVSINCEEQKLAQDVGLDTVEEQVELKAGAERLPDDLDLEPQDGVHVIKDIIPADKIEDSKDQVTEGLSFVHAFLASISVIIVSEIGDKTFFIAAIMAMKHSRLLVFCGALSALGLMTFLSVCLGYATLIVPRSVTFYTCTALLALFGVKMLYEGYNMSPDEGQEEFEEVSEELRKRDETLSQPGLTDTEQGLTTVPPLRRRLRLLRPFVSPIFVQAFTLTFLAEWGDRSQLTTIVLGAREDPIGVTIGGTMGHALCTALAVIGGKIVAQRISVRTVTIIGGVVFLVFALTAFFHDPTATE